MRPWKFLLPLLATSLCFAAQPDRITGPIDSSQMVTLPGRVHRLAQPQYDQGAVESSLPLSYVTMLFAPSVAQTESLDLLLAQQQDRTSPNFHKWLTPEQFADRFGLSANDMQKVTAWLTSQGLQVVSVARGRQFVVFAGTAAQIQNTFRTEIHRYNVQGELHFANASMPSIPTALSGIAVGFRGLNDFALKPALRQHPDYTLTGASTHFLAPGDIATIYDLNPLYTAGINGAGQKIVLVGQTDIYIDDINNFRTDFGLSSVSTCNAPPSCNTTNLRYIQATAAPGYNAGDLGESDLDLEWAGAVAPSAQLIFVTSNLSSGGVTFSVQYAIDNNLAPVISMSYGQCEFDNADPTTGTLSTQDLLYKQAAGQGISFFAAAGDDGPATCDINDSSEEVRSAVQGLAVSYPASSQYVTGVGGTEFNEGTGNYWSTTNNGTTGDSALSYIPEKSWNDFPVLGFLDGGGGGPSNCANQTSDFSECVSGFPKPSWQTGTGVPADDVRDVPDVSFAASNYNDPYIVCVPLSEVNKTGSTSTCASGIANALTVDNSAFGGTSASTPVMAGITVLLNQYLNGTSSAGLGLINPMLYSLASTSPSAFHDTPTGSNSTVNCTIGDPSGQPAPLVCPSGGTFGFSTGTGYDLVTGLGSVDADALAVAWKATLDPDFQLSASTPIPASVSAGQSTTVTLTIAPISGSAPLTVNFAPSNCTGLPAGASCSFSPTSVYFNGTSAPPVTLTISTEANTPLSTQTVTIAPTNSPSTTATVSLTVTATNQTFAIASNTAATFSVAAGATASVPLSVTGTNGFIVTTTTPNTTALAVTYICLQSSIPAEVTCNFSPGSGNSIYNTSLTLNLQTTAPTSQLRPLLGHSNRIFYALLLPGLFGILLASGSRGRGVRLLGLIMVLGFSTLGLGSCSSSGGSNGGQSNPGTPAGKYSIVVNATTAALPGGTALTAAPLTITLVVTN